MYRSPRVIFQKKFATRFCWYSRNWLAQPNFRSSSRTYQKMSLTLTWRNHWSSCIGQTFATTQRPRPGLSLIRALAGVVTLFVTRFLHLWWRHSARSPISSQRVPIKPQSVDSPRYGEFGREEWRTAEPSKALSIWRRWILQFTALRATLMTSHGLSERRTAWCT